jgi:arginase
MHIRILGVPLDLGQNHRGVDMGPFALRAARLDDALRELGHEVVDAGNVHVKLAEEQPYGDDSAKYLAEIAETSHETAVGVYQALASGYFPLSLGGDHSVAIGTLAGVARYFHDRGESIGLLWFDAHADMNTPDTSPSGNIHGMPFAATLGYGPEALTSILDLSPKLDPAKCVLIGARDIDSTERAIVRDSGVNVFTMRQIDEQGMPAIVSQAIALASRGTAGFAVSFDMDVVDPREAPGVGTPIPGGITYREAHLAMEMIADSGRMVALELVEINPILDTMNKTGALGVGLIASALGKRIL